MEVEMERLQTFTLPLLFNDWNGETQIGNVDFIVNNLKQFY